jgi:hypothetical protein
MSVHEDLTVQYHQQDTDYYCGAACAQMVLETIGAGLLDQGGLYADNHSHSAIEPSWYTGPDGLTWTMNDRRPSSFGNSFVLFALANEDSISRKIAWTIHHYQVAPIALVYGWAHWIVVRGYTASTEPTSSYDTSYTISAFDVNNPWPPTPMPGPPPPHAAGDVCGSGGMRGIANEHIAYSTWQSTYMTGVPSGYWAGKYVAVCDPEPPADRVGPSQPPQRLDGERLIGSDEAAQIALAGLRDYGLLERPDWRSALQRTRPGKATLVQRLDHLDRFYYIVPMEAARRRVPAAVSVDARFGDYQQAVSLADGGANLLSVLEPEAALESVFKTKIELEDRQGYLIVRREAYCLYPTLVWKPCRESLSPFYPFYLITVGAHRIYVRVDGAIFTQLHDERGI